MGVLRTLASPALQSVHGLLAMLVLSVAMRGMGGSLVVRHTFRANAP